MKTLEEIKQILRDLKKGIEKKYKAEVVDVFGSYVRGEQKDGSDIDILVKFKHGATLFYLIELANFLEEKLGIKVDVVSERALRSELRKDILEEVVTI